MSDTTTWHYERGQWAETTFLADVWPEDENWDVFLKRLAYEDFISVGAGFWSSFEIKLWRREEPPKYLLDLSDGNISEMLTAATLPDALDLLARYAPIVTAAEIGSAVFDIRDMEPGGIITRALASVEVNSRAVADSVRLERENRAARRRNAAAQRAGGGISRPTSATGGHGHPDQDLK